MRKNDVSRIREVLEDVIFVAGLALMAYVATRKSRNWPAPVRDFMRDR